MYIRGLYGRTERKSIQPIAVELTPGDYDQLHNFIASRSWDTAPLETILARTADQLVGGPNAILAIDDTAVLKKGEHSVGVASQYTGVVGKNTNCQVLVTLTLAGREVPVPMVMPSVPMKMSFMQITPLRRSHRRHPLPPRRR